jgi:hypothetical protein
MKILGDFRENKGDAGLIIGGMLELLWGWLIGVVGSG